MTTTPVFNKAAIISRLQALNWAVNPAVPGYALTDTLRRFQKAHLTPDGYPLVVDGEYGPETEHALFDSYVPKGATLTNRVVAVLASQIGIEEVPYASNKGPQVELYLKAAGAAPANPWCLALQVWAAQQAYRQLNMICPLPRIAHCLTMWSVAAKTSGLKRIAAIEARENPALVLPGMIAIWLIAPLTQAGHAGCVVKRQDMNLETYEGNSNENTGSREGLKVCYQTRRKITDKILMGFIELLPV